MMVKRLSNIARAFGVLALILLSHEVTRAAAPSPELLARVRTMISGYEHVPTASDWSRIGSAEEVVAALMTLADDRRVVIGARAMSSLGHFSRPEVRVFLTARMADEKRHGALRGKAAVALAGAFGDEVAGLIAPLLASAEADLREDAVRALGRLTAPEVERFLRARAEAEPVSSIAERMRATAQTVADRRARAATHDLVPATIAPIADPGPVRR